MAHYRRSPSSSPDPLTMSQETFFSSPTKATQRKPLSTTSGNAQTQDFWINPLPTQDSHSQPPTKNSKTSKKPGSPWHFRVTVQAGQGGIQNQAPTGLSSPSMRFTDHARTTTVPLKSADNSPQPGNQSKGTWAQGSLHSPMKRKGTPKPNSLPAKSVSQQRPITGEGEAKPEKIASSRRYTRRSKNSLETPELRLSKQTITPENRAFESQSHEQERPPLFSMTKEEASSTFMKCRQRQKAPTAVQNYEVEEIDVPSIASPQTADHIDEHKDFDSIIESEGFSMVSVSSLPFTHHNSSDTGNPSLSDLRSSSSTENILTSTASSYSPSSSTTSKATGILQSPKILDKPSHEMTKLSRVVQAGVALQDALGPDSQQIPSSSKTHPLSSPMVSTRKSVTHRRGELFDGFGAGTRRELRAGLRLGEELAKRPEMVSTLDTPTDNSMKEVVTNDRSPKYPTLPTAAQAGEHGPKQPGPSAKLHYPVPLNTQLPSPATSRTDFEEFDRMSWRASTPAQAENSALFSKTLASGTSQELDQTRCDNTMTIREAEWQRERDAVSKQIQMANSSQVIVIDSDSDVQGKDDPFGEGSEIDDVWQEEAQSSHTVESTLDLPNLLFKAEKPRPRRSQLPSPWLDKHNKLRRQIDPLEESDLFWNAVVDGGKPSSSQSEGVLSGRPPSPRFPVLDAALSPPKDNETSNQVTPPQSSSACTIQAPASGFKENFKSKSTSYPVTGQSIPGTFTILDELFGDDEETDDSYREEASTNQSSDDDPEADAGARENTSTEKEALAQNVGAMYPPLTFSKEAESKLVVRLKSRVS
ncbi:MAG: hypothetical protein Q9190_006571, partial [Brigantiaea leucoxantha]